MTAPGLIIAGPASGCGKTLVTLALLRHLVHAGHTVASAKVGPDYIDGAFHTAASGRPCVNLDSWAMRPATLQALVRAVGAGADLVLAEGVMGLFDGAPGGGGSTADIAALTGWPVVLVVDAKGMAASAAALIHGYASHREDVNLAGVIFNRVGGPGHVAVLREACTPLGLPLIGGLPSDAGLAVPDRHLGLVQAHEHRDLGGMLDRAADWAAAHLNIDRLLDLARPATPGDLDGPTTTCALPPLGQRIAVARDAAFAFAYSYVLDDWRAAGAEVLPFSPLAGEGPDATADAVYLPGGYPELHAGRLAANQDFMTRVRAAAERGVAIYGECGGYMVLGRGLEDRGGERHEMAGLLPVVTSFSTPRLTLGYREVTLGADSPLGDAGSRFRGHEFHYARLCGPEGEAPLFECRNVRGHDLGSAGSRQGSVMGSFIHLVDRADERASAEQRSTAQYGA